MNYQMLQSFNESTLKAMIIDLHAENTKLKDEENKAVEEKQKEIWKLEHQVGELQIDLKISKDRCQIYYEESKSCPKTQIVHWMEQNCIEADNVLSKDGIMSYAPTDYETLYDNYVEWCQEEELQNRADKKTFKTEILDWQKNSKYGLSIGKTKEESEGMPNGYLRSPLINLKIV
jgi:hypothetical protein